MKYMHIALIGGSVGCAMAINMIAACSSASSDPGTNTSSSSSSGSGDSSPDTNSVTNPNAPVICCPPDPAPSCCMKYGGQVAPAGCVSTCDGMPVASDPDWKLAKDDFGCPKWSNPHDTFRGGTAGATTHYCGDLVGPPPDAGEDAD